MIKQIIPGGCNRECFALTDQGQLWLLKYSSGDSFEWILMSRPCRPDPLEDIDIPPMGGNGHTSEPTS